MELITVEEAARVLKVSVITVRRYVASGRLPSVRVGRNVRIERDALERFGRGEPSRPEEPIMRPVEYKIRPGETLMVRDDRGTYDAFGGMGGPNMPEQDTVQGVVLTLDHAIWRHLGMATVDDAETDVSENKAKYLADAYTTRPE